MNDDGMQIGVCLSIAALAALWICAYFCHLGPDDLFWWTIPYYLTVVGASVGIWMGGAVGLCALWDHIDTKLQHGKGENNG